MRTKEVVSSDGDRTVYIYNDAGLQLRTTDYDANGNVVFDIHYKINPLEQFVGWKVFDANGSVVKRFEVDYDTLGLEIERRQYGSDDKLERRVKYLYDDDNELIEEHHIDPAGQLRSKKVYTSRGDEIIENYYDVQGNPIDGPAV